MKDYLSKIQNRIKNLISFKKINPHNHWNNLLYIFFATTIILIIFSLYLLYEIKNSVAPQLTPESNEKPSLVDEKIFNKVSESFGNKLLNQKEVEEGLKVYRDPSM
ncbi:MAG: hypothetical protein JJE53_01260 [Candidatus Pacebacteria bacterium]|nr:hypothetical protein [Candidatus Paceibacterota bacterium]